MSKEIELKNIEKMLTNWQVSIYNQKAVNFFDLTRTAQDLAVKLINAIYKLNLVNLDKKNRNNPGIDLGDRDKGIAYQVTSISPENAFDKIRDNLDTFQNKHRVEYQQGIRFLFLNPVIKKFNKNQQKTFKSICPIFNVEEHIIGINDLSRKIDEIYDNDQERFEKINKILKREFENEKSINENKSSHIIDCHLHQEVLDHIIENLPEKHFRLKEYAFTISEKLQENINVSIKNGNNNSLESEREEIVDQINYIANIGLGKSFDEIYNELQKHLVEDNKKSIYFIVVAMTKSESEKLFSSIGQNKILNDFLGITFRGKEGKEFISDLRKQYNEDRSNWRPFGEDKVIRELIENIIVEYTEKTKIKLYYNFIEKQFFSDEFEVRGNIINFIENNNCVFIIDLISLFHDEIYNHFIQSQLIKEKPVICISPINEELMSIKKKIMDTIKTKLEIVYSRYKRDLDKSCMIEIQSVSAFLHCLFGIIPVLINGSLKPNPNIVNEMIRSTNYTQRGIGDKIFSKGGSV